MGSRPVSVWTRLSVSLLLLLAVAPAASARPKESGATPLERAREEAPDMPRLKTSVIGPAGAFYAKPAEYLASARSDITLILDPGEAATGTLLVDLPARMADAVRSGGPGPLGAPRAEGAARVRRDGRRLRIDLDAPREGRLVEVGIPDRGIPAGTYDLGVTHVAPSGDRRDLGRIQVRLLAPVREAASEPNPWGDVRAVNVTADASTESETFITVSPKDPSRVLAGANGSASYAAWISTNGGTSFTRRALPSTLNFKGNDDAGQSAQVMCCDPMSAGNAEGDLWYGGLSYNAEDEGFIVVNRIAAGTTTFQSTTVAIPRRTLGIQDKPMMTIDNSATSPTFGRLYVAWGEPGNNGGVNIVASLCDTRPGGGELDAARCDDADNWSDPVDITRAAGSYIYADVAVAHDGRVHAVWWDYSSVNAIRGATCDPSAGACTVAANWGTIKTIAILDYDGANNNIPIPFACPIIAQPGGRAGPDPMVETDISRTSTRGKVYVTWSDLVDDGTTRCAVNQANPNGTTPQTTHDAWDSFVVSADGALPGSSAASATVGTRLLDVSENPSTQRSDDWFPWLAVDQATGTAYAGFYSTRTDSTRQTTHFYVRTVGTQGLGALTQASTDASNYSTAACCGFGNDYGDYTGVDAACGSAFPIWSDKLGAADGEAMILRINTTTVPCLVFASRTLTEVTGLSDGDGAAEPGETVDLTPTLRNSGTGASGAVSSTLGGTAELEIVTATAQWPAIAAGSTAASSAPFRVRILPGAPCAAPSRVPLSVTESARTHDIHNVTTGPRGDCSVAPFAAFSATPASPQANQEVTLNASGSSDLDGTITNYEWDLDGNGTYDKQSPQPTTTHTFTSTGVKLVRLRITDDDGRQATAEAGITVAGVGPVATATPSATATATATTGPGATATATATAVPSNVVTPGCSTKPSVTINDGARWTRTLDVELDVTPACRATGLLVANDPSLETASLFTITAAGRYRWELDGEEPETTPRVVFVAFRGITAATVRDSIVLDTKKPRIVKARLLTTGFRFSGRDAGSGLGTVEFSANKRRIRRRVVLPAGKAGATRLTARVTAPKTITDARYVRITDRAGNKSGWSRLKLPKTGIPTSAGPGLVYLVEG